MGKKVTPIIYTKEQLHKRKLNLYSQLLFGKYLDTDIITKLIDLFKDNKNNTTSKIVKYVEEERKAQGLNNTNIKITSEIYNTSSDDSTLHLQIIKNGIDFIHLSIHLVPKTINPNNDGLIHIFKNIYKPKGETNKTKTVTRSRKNRLYALISVNEPEGKPHSLEFSIDNNYYKTNVPNITNSIETDKEINKEMNVIITVLNRLFDENDELYIGNKDKIYEVNINTDKVLNNINNHSILVSRKNKGTKTIFGRNVNNTIPRIPVIYTTKKILTRKQLPIIYTTKKRITKKQKPDDSG